MSPARTARSAYRVVCDRMPVANDTLGAGHAVIHRAVRRAWMAHLSRASLPGMAVGLAHPDLAHLLRWVQDGVLARRQLLAAGATDRDIRRLVRRRELTVAHPGVYVDHTGPLSYEQREWVAVLAAWPAALAGASAIPGRPQRIEVAVEHGRKVRMPRGSVVRRRAKLREQVRPGSNPPRMQVEHAIIDVMARALARGDVAEAFAQLTRTCFDRRTSPERIIAVLAERERVAGRRVMEGLLSDLRDGACSVLERGYLHRVERAHGLPQARRQARSTATGAATDSDVRYDEYGVIVELDGRAFHDTARTRDADARRDLAERAVSDATTLRVTYGLVFDDPCRTASWIAEVLRRRGWTGQPQGCPACDNAA